jgi:hypothetical protein
VYKDLIISEQLPMIKTLGRLTSKNDLYLTEQPLKNQRPAGCRWFTPVILTSQEAEIRIVVEASPDYLKTTTTTTKTPSHTHTHTHTRGGGAGRVTQGVGLEFKTQYRNKTK